MSATPRGPYTSIGTARPSTHGSEHQVRQAKRVIGVQVSNKDARQLRRRERRHAGRGRTPHDTHAGVNQIRLIVDDDGDGRTEAIGIRIGIARAQEHHTCATGLNCDAGGFWKALGPTELAASSSPNNAVDGSRFIVAFHASQWRHT
jgi:hypothetical protein